MYITLLANCGYFLNSSHLPLEVNHYHCSKKPNRRRSRSVELTPIRMTAPSTPNPHIGETPKKDRVSDATYVSMHKFSRVPVGSASKPTRQPPRPPQPPSLSKLPGSVFLQVLRILLVGLCNVFCCFVMLIVSSNTEQCTVPLS